MEEFKNFIGCKLVKSKPMTRNEWLLTKPERHEPPSELDMLGYLVLYPDGYTSWNPKEQFEKYYFGIENENKLSQKDIDNFIIEHIDAELDSVTSLSRVRLVNNWTITETASCIKPETFDHKIGYELCQKRIENKVWELLGFMLKTAIYGINNKEKD